MFAAIPPPLCRYCSTLFCYARTPLELPRHILFFCHALCCACVCTAMPPPPLRAVDVDAHALITLCTPRSAPLIMRQRVTPRRERHAPQAATRRELRERSVIVMTPRHAILLASYAMLPCLFMRSATCCLMLCAHSCYFVAATMRLHWRCYACAPRCEYAMRSAHYAAAGVCC